MLSRLKTYIHRMLPQARWEQARMRWWQFQRAVATDHSALRLPWFATSPSSDLQTLHTLAMEIDWQYVPHLEARACLWLTSIAWPLVSCRQIIRELRSNGAVVRSYGISRWRQIVGMAYLANRHNIPPSSYYRYRMFDAAHANRPDRWIHHYEICNLLSELNRNSDEGRLGDKDRFYEEATSHGLPVAPVIAIFRAGAVSRWCRDNDQLPECDLVFKPVDLNSGARFERWTYDAKRWASEGVVLDANEFLKYCRRRSDERPHVLQERLFNHPRLASLAGNGLCTIRIVTYRRPQGPPAALMATFRMPTGTAMVDNINAGGLAAPVDLATGLLGRAVPRHLTGGIHDLHPTSGAPISGVQLPAWHEAVALSLRAHDCFAWMPFIGWDVVPGPNGPLLLEANPVWSSELLQIPHGRPLGDTEFTTVFLEHLRRAS